MSSYTFAYLSEVDWVLWVLNNTSGVFAILLGDLEKLAVRASRNFFSWNMESRILQNEKFVIMGGINNLWGNGPV